MFYKLWYYHDFKFIYLQFYFKYVYFAYFGDFEMFDSIKSTINI